MSYQQTIEAHHQRTYSDTILMVAQQMQNPLRAAVTVKGGLSGEAYNVADLIDKVDYQEGEDYSQTNPENPPERIRRWVTRPTVIQSGQIITKEEKFDQAMDPTSNLNSAHVKAVERGVFDRLLGVRKKTDGTGFEISGGGILGYTQSGKDPGSRVALPSGNYVAHNAAGSTTGLNAEKLRAACEAMELEEFGMETDDDIYGLITPKQKTDLINLAIATKTSLDPFQVEAIREGKPGTLLGINWIFTNRLPVDPSGYRLVPLWSKQNILGAFWQDVEGMIFNNGHKRNLPQIIVDAYPTASRIEDGGVRVIRCEES